MRKLKVKELVVLVLPVLALVALALIVAMPRREPKFVLERATATPLSFPGMKPGVIYTIDTHVAVVFKYESSSWLPQFLAPPKFQHKGWRLVDEKGKTYIRNMTSGSSSLGANRYEKWFEFPTRQVPRSVGKLTFKVDFRSNEGAKLPVSVLVRDAAN